MKTPPFWFQPPGTLSTLLKPVAQLYQALGRLRRGKPVFTPTPLIVVGNVVAGGAGKTPVTLALAKFLQSKGLRVHLIAKGYGGRLAGPVQVNPEQYTARDVGDEPLLLARQAPTFIGRNRGAALLLASQDADIVISDDGLQSPHLVPTLALLVMDGVLGIGNGQLIPAGPLREPLSRALRKAQAVVQVGGQARDYSGTPVIVGDFVPHSTEWLRGAHVLAFAGIGQPEKFFATLTTAGAKLQAALPFADHHAYSEDEIKRLVHQADAAEAILVTTSKDAVRIPPSLREQVRVVEGEFIWRDMGALEQLLAPLITR
jgi:tetraacyldisaccharide 4'-kinase